MHFRKRKRRVARIVIDRHQGAFIVPKAALLRSDETGAHLVVTMTTDSLARTVEVNVGATTDSTVEVISDEILEGMKVIIEGQYALTDSTRVTVVKQGSR